MDLLREDVMKMKVAELKMALQHRGAPASGVKAVLLERLLGLMENDKISDKPSSPQGIIIIYYDGVIFISYMC